MLQPPLADPGSTHSNVLAGHGVGHCRKDLLFPLLSLLSAQAHKPLIFHLPCSSFRSMHETLADTLAECPQYLKAAHGWCCSGTSDSGCSLGRPQDEPLGAQGSAAGGIRRCGSNSSLPGSLFPWWMDPEHALTASDRW